MAVRWVFTLNNWTPEEYSAVETFAATCRCCVVGKERGNGTPHLQGAFVLRKRQRLAGLKKVFPRAHFEPMRGTWEQQLAYCGKEGDVATWGEHLPERGRGDLSLARTVITEAPDMDSWRSDVSIEAVVAKYPRWCQMVWDLRKPPVFELPDLRPWQQELLDMVALPAEDRKIHWYVDFVGGAGKTTISKYLLSRGAFKASGKAADILYAYSQRPADICIFDFPRSNAEFICYGAVEAIKDGTFFVGKYESHCFYKPTATHVIVFANCEPEPGKFSVDRLILHRLSEPAWGGP